MNCFSMFSDKVHMHACVQHVLDENEMKNTRTDDG